MEGEIINFVVIWSTIFACLCYCHTRAKFIPKGTTRLLTILPVICLFFFLPFILTTVYLGVITRLFISWLANFKLLLFAFGQAISGGMAKFFLDGAKFEEQFDEPYISTSLHDFWGRRWNVMVSKILREAVYIPVRSISKRFLGRNLALYPAILATFFVSGIMHETLLYHMAQVKTRSSWELTCYFLVHGVCLDLEIGLKRAFKGKFSLPPTVSRLLTMAFVFATSIWLFVPPCLRAKLDVRTCTETLAFIEFIKHQRLVSPTNFTCPF